MRASLTCPTPTSARAASDVRSPMCPRLASELTTLRCMYRHLSKKDLRRMIRQHTCPTCAGYEVPRWLARDPRDDPRTTQ